MNTQRLLISLYRFTYWYHRLAQVLWLVIRIVAVLAGVLFIITLITNPPLAESSSSFRDSDSRADLTLLWILLLLTVVLTIASVFESVAKWRMKLATNLYLGRAWRWLQFGVAMGSVVALILVRRIPGLPPLFWGTLYALAWLVAIGVPIFGLWLGLAGWHSVAYRYIVFWMALTIGKVRHWLLTGWRGALVMLAATTVLAWVYSQLLGARRALTDFLTPDLALQVLAINAATVVLYWALHARRSIVVLSFVDHTGDANLKSSVEGIPTRLLNELISLSRLYQSIRGYGTLDPGDIAPSEQEKNKKDEQAGGKGIDYSSLSPADIGQTLQGIAATDSKIKIGPLEIPIGFLAATFGRLVEGPRLSGSLQRVGDQFVLLAQITGGNLRGSWRVNQSDLGLEETSATSDTFIIEQLIHQLAYRVFTDLEQDRLGSVRWRAVYWFSDGLRAYRDAYLSKFDHVANLHRAEHAFARALSYDNQFAQCHYNLGITYLNLRKRDLARQSFERAGELAPGFIDAYYALADFYWYYTSPDDLWASVRYFDHILLVRPDEARAWWLKAITLRSLNDTRQIRRSPLRRERAWAIEQASVAVALAWRQLCRRAWHNELSQPHRASTARYLQGNGLLLDDVYDLSSQTVLRQALYLAPDNATIHSNIGWALSREGDFAGAMRAFQPAAQMSNRPEDWRDFAWACQRRFAFIQAISERLKVKLRFTLSVADAAAESSAWSNLLQLADRLEDKQFEEAVGFIKKPRSNLNRDTRRTIAVRRTLECARDAAQQIDKQRDAVDGESTLTECERLIKKLIQRREFYAKHKHCWIASLIARQLAQFGDALNLRWLLRAGAEKILRQTVESLQDLQKVIEPKAVESRNLQQVIAQLEKLQWSSHERSDEWLQNIQRVIEPLRDLRSLSSWHCEEQWAIRRHVLNKIHDQVRNFQGEMKERTDDVQQSLKSMVEQLQNLQFLRPERAGDVRQQLENLVMRMQNLQQILSENDTKLTGRFQQVIEHLQRLDRAIKRLQTLEQAVKQVQALEQEIEPIKNLQQAIKWLEEIDLTQSIRDLRLPHMLVSAGLSSEGIRETVCEKERDAIVTAAEQAIAFDPDDMAACQQLGRINLLNHYFARAEQELTNSFKLQPNSPESVQWLALAHWTHALSAPETNTRRAELLRGVTMLEQVLDIIEKNLSPLHSYEVNQQSWSRGWAHYWLGRFYSELLKHMAALEHLQVAVSLGCAINEAQLEMGRIYLRCRTYDRAEQCFLDMIQRNQTEFEPYRHRVNNGQKHPREWIATARLFLALTSAERGGDQQQSRRHVRDSIRDLGPIRSVIGDRRCEYIALLLSCRGWLDFIAVREDAIDEKLKAPYLTKSARQLEKSVGLVASAEGYFKLGQVYSERARLDPACCERWSGRAERAYRRARDLDLRGEYTAELDKLLKPAAKSENSTP